MYFDVNNASGRKSCPAVDIGASPAFGCSCSVDELLASRCQYSDACVGQQHMLYTLSQLSGSGCQLCQSAVSDV